MIETIYNSENNENKKPDINIRLPKNIRQVGQSDVSMSCQIYIEENVFAYIRKESQETDKLRYGVLLGEKKQGNGYTYIFINGMIEVEDIIENTIIFSDDVWTDIYDNIRRYYRNGSIVGWFASTYYDVSKDMHGIRKIHLDHFAGNNKVFLNINREEADEAFYIYERNNLRKQPCYHVYFEKSDEFEDYLFGTGRDTEEEQAKQTRAKETGKYGIALNNLKSNTGIGKAEKPDESREEGIKLPNISKYKRVASFLTILVLAGVMGYMGKEGQFNALQDKMKGLVGNILDKDNSKASDYISVNGDIRDTMTTGSSGSKQNEVQSESGQTTGNASEDDEQMTTEVSGKNTTEINGENTTEVNDENTTEVSQENSIQNSEENTTKVSGGESTTTTEASVSVPNTNYETYVVKAGETLYSIAMAKYGNADKVQEIMALNKMENENYVMEGQKILLP